MRTRQSVCVLRACVFDVTQGPLLGPSSSQYVDGLARLNVCIDYRRRIVRLARERSAAGPIKSETVPRHVRTARTTSAGPRVKRGTGASAPRERARGGYRLSRWRPVARVSRRFRPLIEDLQAEVSCQTCRRASVGPVRGVNTARV